MASNIKITREAARRLFADSNVFIQAVLQPESAPATVMNMVASGTFELLTCQEVIHEVKNALAMRFKDDASQLAQVMADLLALIVKTKLTIVADRSKSEVQATFDLYMSSMRHDADIPILAAALNARPDIILSANRQHFNDQVARKCGIRICSCQEFLHWLARSQ